MSKRNKEGCVGIILRIFGIEGPVPAPPLPYRLRDKFLSSAENSFFYVLNEVLGPEYYLIAKVSLSDLFSVPKSRVSRAALKRIRMKHVDFVICDAKTMQPLLGVELDDAGLRSQRGDDTFVEKVFETAKLPLLRVTAAKAYVPGEIAEMIDRALEANEE